MILKIKDRNGNPITLNKIDKINDLIAILKIYTEKNPTKELEDKLRSLLASETFNTLFTEGEVSSRRHIKQIFNKKDSTHGTSKDDEKIENFIGAYNLVLKPTPFSISSLFTLYSTITLNIIDDEDKLSDGEMFRNEPVYINSNQVAGDFQGFKPENIKNALSDLCDFLNNSDLDIYLKAIIGHIYFEMIHPFYDFNGRTGRFIPLWLFTNTNKTKEMMYFATAIGNFKEQYRSMFNKNIDHNTYKVNMDQMIIKLLMLLIVNQHQYIWLKETEKKYTNKTNKLFTSLQKDFIWRLMNKLEVAGTNDAWLKFTDEDKDFVDTNMRQASFSVDTTDLEKADIVQITDGKPRNYKLLNYKICEIRQK